MKNTLELYPTTVAHTSKGDDIAAQTTRKFKAEMAKIMQCLKRTAKGNSPSYVWAKDKPPDAPDAAAQF